VLSMGALPIIRILLQDLLRNEWHEALPLNDLQLSKARSHLKRDFTVEVNRSRRGWVTGDLVADKTRKFR